MNLNIGMAAAAATFNEDDNKDADEAHRIENDVGGDLMASIPPCQTSL